MVLWEGADWEGKPVGAPMVRLPWTRYFWEVVAAAATSLAAQPVEMVAAAILIQAANLQVMGRIQADGNDGGISSRGGGGDGSGGPSNFLWLQRQLEPIM